MHQIQKDYLRAAAEYKVATDEHHLVSMAHLDCLADERGVEEAAARRRLATGAVHRSFVSEDWEKRRIDTKIAALLEAKDALWEWGFSLLQEQKYLDHEDWDGIVELFGTKGRRNPTIAGKVIDLCLQVKAPEQVARERRPS